MGVEREGFLDYQGRAGSFPLCSGTLVQSYSVLKHTPIFQYQISGKIQTAVSADGAYNLCVVLSGGIWGSSNNRFYADGSEGAESLGKSVAKTSVLGAQSSAFLLSKLDFSWVLGPQNCRKLPEIV